MFPSKSTSINVPKSTKGIIFKISSRIVVRVPKASCKPPYSVIPSTCPTKPPVKSFTLLIFITFSTTQSSTDTSPLILPANEPVAKTLGSPSPLGFSKFPNTSPRSPNNPDRSLSKSSKRPCINPR